MATMPESSPTFIERRRPRRPACQAAQRRPRGRRDHALDAQPRSRLGGDSPLAAVVRRPSGEFLRDMGGRRHPAGGLGDDTLLGGERQRRSRATGPRPTLATLTRRGRPGSPPYDRRPTRRRSDDRLLGLARRDTPMVARQRQRFRRARPRRRRRHRGPDPRRARLQHRPLRRRRPRPHGRPLGREPRHEAAAEADRAFADGRTTSASKPKRASPSSKPASAPTSSAATPPPPPAASPASSPLESPTPPPLRRPGAEQDVWYVRGRDQGLNFDLEARSTSPASPATTPSTPTPRRRARRPRRRSRRSGRARAARRGWRRRSPPTAPRWRSGPASACRSTGRRRR